MSDDNWKARLAALEDEVIFGTGVIHHAADGTVTHIPQEDFYVNKCDWQPIETAPKDGTEVLLWIPPNEYAPGFPEVAQYWAEPPRYAGWVGVRTHSPYYEATHWMPLPSPPSTIDRRTE